MTKPKFETEPDKAPPPLTARELDGVLRTKIEKLLNTVGMWNLHSYGWITAYDPDPEFIGHAMWQTEPPFDHDHLWSIGRRKGARNPPPQPTPVQQLLAVSGADFDGLMDAARMSICLLLLQAEAIREFQFHDDKFFDLHHLSAVIYLATASERIREFFIAAAFRVPQKKYQNGAFRDRKRSQYTTPFLEARESLSASSPEAAEALAKVCPLAEHIRDLRNTRNELIHELATAIGRRERKLFQESPNVAEVEDFKFEDIQKIRKAAEAETERRISDAAGRLAGWYGLLVQLSNEAFIVEHAQRKAGVETAAAGLGLGRVKTSWWSIDALPLGRCAFEAGRFWRRADFTSVVTMPSSPP